MREAGRTRPRFLRDADLEIGDTAALESCATIRAFSLIEILMTVAMLSIIILGLVAMFDQTRRAFTSSMQQVDYLEGGRATMQLIANDLEQLAPSYAPTFNTGITPDPNFENFYMDLPNLNPVVQPLADPTESRSNYLQEFFFISRNNQYWNAIGYRIDKPGEAAGIGTLYRYSFNNIPVNSAAPAGLLELFITNGDVTQLPNFSKIIDGVIDLRVRAYDSAGNLLPNINTPPTSPIYNRNNNIYVQTNTVTGEPVLYNFRSNAVPAYVEVELGVLENRTLQRYYSMTNNPQVAGQYLTNHAGQVHIFRQRVPIRAVDPSVYTNLLPVLP